MRALLLTLAVLSAVFFTQYSFAKSGATAAPSKDPPDPIIVSTGAVYASYITGMTDNPAVTRLADGYLSVRGGTATEGSLIRVAAVAADRKFGLGLGMLTGAGIQKVMLDLAAGGLKIGLGALASFDLAGGSAKFGGGFQWGGPSGLAVGVAGGNLPGVSQLVSVGIGYRTPLKYQLELDILGGNGVPQVDPGVAYYVGAGFWGMAGYRLATQLQTANDLIKGSPRVGFAWRAMFFNLEFYYGLAPWTFLGGVGFTL